EIAGQLVSGAGGAVQDTNINGGRSGAFSDVTEVESIGGTAVRESANSVDIFYRGLGVVIDGDRDGDSAVAEVQCRQTAGACSIAHEIHRDVAGIGPGSRGGE